MTILFFTRRFYPLIGGVEKHVLEISKIFVKKGYKVIVITEKNSSLLKDSKVEGIQVLRINVGKEGFSKKFRIWKELSKHLRILVSADIVHCHDVFFWYLPFRFIFPLKKVYTTFHGYEGNSLPTKKAILMHKIAEKLSFGNICVGDFFTKWYGTNPTFVTYGGVDKELINKGNENIKPTKDIMFLGRLEEETGIMKYLEALKLLKDKNVNFSLDVFGDGKLLSKAKKYSKQNNLKVSFKGFVVNPEKFLTDYKYIFVSRYLGILETLVAKRPVFVVYDNDIKRDYLKLTPFSKFISISSTSEEISNNVLENKQNKAQDAYSWVKKQTWEKMVNTYLQLWKIQ